MSSYHLNLDDMTYYQKVSAYNLLYEPSDIIYYPEDLFEEEVNCEVFK